MPLPKEAESADEGGADWNLPGFAAFGVFDPKDVASAVDVFRANVEGFAHAQAAVVNEGEVGAVAVVAEGAEEFGDFFARKDVRKGLVALDFYFSPDLPGFAEVIAVKGAQGADRLVDGGAGEFTLVLEVKEEVENLAGVEIGEARLGEVVGELGDPAEIGFDGALAQALELDKAGVILIPLGSDKVLVRRGVFFS